MDENNLPQFSVVLPTYNRPDLLANCLKALENQEYPSNRYEIIVVDDGSQVSPQAIVAHFQSVLNL